METPARIETSDWSCNVVGAAPGGSETILFVEDEAFVRNVASEVLRSAGYTVLVAHNAAEGLAKFSENRGKVQLLITDVILPGETGRALAHRLRVQNPLLKVLFITGYAEQLQVEGTGNTEYLAKPFSTGILLRKVREVLDRHAIWPEGSAALRRASGSA